MIPRVAIVKTKQITASRGIHDPIDPWQGERIFRACFVEIGIINTHPPFFILFAYKDRIGKPIRVIYFFDEPSG